MSDVVKWNQLRWLGGVLRKDNGDWVKKSTSYEVEGVRGKGRPRTMWSHVVGFLRLFTYVCSIRINERVYVF